MRILRLDEACQKTRLKKSALYAAIAEGTFPAPVRIGRCSGWCEHELDAWIQARIDERDARLARAESGDRHDIRQEA